MAEDRIFTLEEANARLEDLRARLPRIQKAREVVLRSAQPIREHAATNGGGADGAAHWQALRELRRDLEALSAEGIVLRDSETGLVDFPSRREGRLVYLCWKLGEDEVAHWHEVDAGFGGRKRL